MKTRTEPVRGLGRNWRQRCSLALLLGLLLAGCGPGTGGTGTGTDALPVGASAADGYQWYLGPWGGSGLVTAGSAGTALCSTPGHCAPGDVWSLFDASGIELTARCWGFRYQGAWSVSGQGELRIAGSYTEQGSVAQRPAVLLGTPAGKDLALTLQDASGAALQGPMTLSRLSPGQTASAQTCAGG